MSQPFSYVTAMSTICYLAYQLTADSIGTRTISVLNCKTEHLTCAGVLNTSFGNFKAQSPLPSKTHFVDPVATFLSANP